MHEIITLQFGHFSNFVGAHFWNAQEAHFTYQQPSINGEEEEPPKELLNHDCLYRVGQTRKGTETYTPRALIYDLKGGFGSIKKYRLYEDELYSQGADHLHQQLDVTWDPSKMETFQEQEYELSAYQQHLEDEEKGLATEEEEEDIDMNEIKSWSDYTRVFYHPKSMVTLSGGYQLDSDFTSFDVFSYGRSAFAETEKERDSYDENFRMFAEECDQLQGIQVMADVLDGWGGFTASFLEQLREDFPKTSIITFGVMDEKMADCSTLRKTQTVLVNEALTTTHLSRLSSLYVPVRAPTKSVLNLDGWSKNLRIDPTSRYHTSAFISSAIDSALLPCRLRQNSSLLADEIGSLNWRNITTIGTLSASLPFSFGGPSLPKLTGKNSSLLDLSSRRFTEDDQIYSQSVVLRGLEIAQFAKYSAGTQKTPSDIVEELLDTLPIGNSLGSSRTISSVRYPIPTSFPRFFQGLTIDGYQSTGPLPPNRRSDGTSKVTSTPTLSRLAVSTSTRWQLEHLSDSLRRINWRLMPQFESDATGGVSSDEFDETKESLLELYDIYNE